MKVAVVFEHSGVYHLRITDAVELRKVGVVESAAYLDCTVAAEVEEDYRIAVFDCSDRLAVFGYDKRRQILVYRAGFFPQRFDCGAGGGKHPLLA